MDSVAAVSSTRSPSSAQAATKKQQHAAALPSLITWFSGARSPLPPRKPAKPAPTAGRTPPTTLHCSIELHRVFRYFDEGGDGKISAAELQSCMRAMGEELSDEEAEAVVELADSDGDGLLGLEDMVRLVDQGEEGEQEKERNMREAFRVYEMEGEGCITPKSLRSALGRLGESRSMEECRVMIRRFDIDGDGVISFDEFRVMIR